MFLLNKIHSFGNKYEVWEGKTLVGVVSNTEGNEYTGGLILNLLECGYEVVKAKTEAKRNVPIFGLDDLPEGVAKTAFDSFKAVMKNKSGKTSAEDIKTKEKIKFNLFPKHERNNPLCQAKHIFGCTSCGYNSECSESGSSKSEGKSEGGKLAESLSELLGVKAVYVSGDSELSSMLDLLGVPPSLINDLSEMPEPCYHGKVNPTCYICPVSEGCFKFKKELLDSIRKKRDIKGECSGCGNCKLLNGNCEICPNGEFKLIATKEAYYRLNSKTAEPEKESPDKYKKQELKSAVSDMKSSAKSNIEDGSMKIHPVDKEIIKEIKDLELKDFSNAGISESKDEPDYIPVLLREDEFTTCQCGSGEPVSNCGCGLNKSHQELAKEVSEGENERLSENSPGCDSLYRPEEELCKCGSGEMACTCVCEDYLPGEYEEELSEDEDEEEESSEDPEESNPKYIPEKNLCKCGSGKLVSQCDCSF